jgi:TPP-dependent 2-oxoacid decarboxylase
VSWGLLGLFFSATILSGAVLGAALGLTGFAILHFMGGGAVQLGVQAVKA